jgi:hypothetical protein
MLNNDLDSALALGVLFPTGVFGLLLLLAWLEQPASERWWPAWWRKRQSPNVGRPTVLSSGGPAVGRRGAEDGVPTSRARR